MLPKTVFLPSGLLLTKVLKSKTLPIVTSTTKRTKIIPIKSDTWRCFQYSILSFKFPIILGHNYASAGFCVIQAILFFYIGFPTIEYCLFCYFIFILPNVYICVHRFYCRPCLWFSGFYGAHCLTQQINFSYLFIFPYVSLSIIQLIDSYFTACLSLSH